MRQDWSADVPGWPRVKAERSEPKGSLDTRVPGDNPRTAAKHTVRAADGVYAQLELFAEGIASS